MADDPILAWDFANRPPWLYDERTRMYAGSFDDTRWVVRVMTDAELYVVAFADGGPELVSWIAAHSLDEQRRNRVLRYERERLTEVVSYAIRSLTSMTHPYAETQPPAARPRPARSWRRLLRPSRPSSSSGPPPPQSARELEAQAASAAQLVSMSIQYRLVFGDGDTEADFVPRPAPFVIAKDSTGRERVSFDLNHRLMWSDLQPFRQMPPYPRDFADGLARRVADHLRLLMERLDRD